MSRKLKTNIEYDNELFDKEIDAIRIGDYVGALIPIEHICINEHIWKAAPNDVLRKKHKCPHCNTLTEVSTTLYHLSFVVENITYYKIGISNRNNLAYRYGSEWEAKQMQVLWSIQYPTRYLAKAHEQLILHNNLAHLLNDNKLVNGNTEVLTKEVIEPQPIG